jgi:hypothetical protein
MEKGAAKATKLESRAAVLLGGLQARAKKLEARLAGLITAAQDAWIEVECFKACAMQSILFFHHCGSSCCLQNSTNQ